MFFTHTIKKPRPLLARCKARFTLFWPEKNQWWRHAMENREQSDLSRIAVVGDYLPRQCGIATFTTDLCEALAAEHPDATCFAVPVNDTDQGYAYPPRVRFEITERDLASYRVAADFLNVSNVDLVCLQ